MHLKSLTLKGFKSFASSTTLHFEKGITAVVGPNGSGKSNVVDAIAWVLGEQGVKALRGGKMQDVIFAGTADRPPLGRAEVTLTIDNSDRALPIDYTEVSITRRMFRDGGGEYEINGSSCRLLDIQELLSDSGIGREMHVIVGQGQLDAVLSGRPEDRRAFIEEAAGVLKHRKRKEKALRKLDAMRANLTRITDLTAELRRQLGPLGRQAEVARRAAGVQADLRDSRLRLLAEETAMLTAQIATDTRDEQAAVALRDEVQVRLAQAIAAEESVARELTAATPTLAQAQETWFALSALAERFRGTIALAHERARSLSVELQAPSSGRDPAELEAAADAAEAEQQQKMTAVGVTQAALADAELARTEAERALRAAEAEIAAAARAIADRREGLARLTGQVNTARSRLTAGDEEATRLAATVTDARGRAAVLRAQFESLQQSIGELDSSEVDLDTAHEDAEAAALVASDRVTALRDEHREASSRQRALRARVDALSLGLTRKDGAGALLAAGGQLPGVLGPVSAALNVTPGAESAIAAALGPLADAIAVGQISDAAGALEMLKESEAGRAQLVIAGSGERISGERISGERISRERVAEPGAAGAPARVPAGIAHSDTSASGPSGAPLGPLPDGCIWAADAVSPRPELAAVIRSALRGVVIVDDIAAAVSVVNAHPELLAATRSGDLLARGRAAGGSTGKQSLIELQAAVDEAESDLAALTGRITELEAAQAGATTEAGRLAERAKASLAALHESDARMSAIAEQLARLGESTRAAIAEAERAEHARDAAETARESHQSALADLEARLAAAAGDEAPAEVDATARDLAARTAAGSRDREVEARLALRTAEERARSTAGTAESLRRAARAERQSRSRFEQTLRRRRAGAAVATRVAEAGERAAALLARSLTEAATVRDAAAAARSQAEQAAATARATVGELQAEWDALTGTVHSGEIQRAQQDLRLQQLADRAAEEFGMGTDDVVAEFGPDVPVPPTAAEIAEYEAAKQRGEDVARPAPMPYDRPTQERRAKRAERDLRTLGKVNPLALEEFAALEERHAFLSTQLADLKATRKDLLTVIEEVDQKIQDLFTSAYHDVAREFVEVFAALFPGGSGELVLTDPQDMLATGIEVNARPPGKKVRRLSLLSGGERSLVAVAMLVAIFRARPSPFYIMDEVEAALDEVNLARLVGLLSMLRDSSQLIIITHQKYTMEAADALYGVSMRGDGITQVISQRIGSSRENAVASN